MKNSLFNPTNYNQKWPDIGPLNQYELARLDEKVDFDNLYSLPKNTLLCKKCVISNQRPRITINEDGICNACKFWDKKDSQIDWNQRSEAFRALCDKYRSKDGSFDV